MKRRSTQRGMALIELLVGLTIISIALVSLLTTYRAHLKAALANTNAIKASYLAEEAFEAVRFLKDSNWNGTIANKTNGTAYYLSWNGTSWTVTTTPQYVDEFLRTITFSAVNRDSNDDITTSGGTLDPNIKKVDVTIAWQETSATTTKTLSTYMTKLSN